MPDLSFLPEFDDASPGPKPVEETVGVAAARHQPAQVPNQVGRRPRDRGGGHGSHEDGCRRQGQPGFASRPFQDRRYQAQVWLP